MAIRRRRGPARTRHRTMRQVRNVDLVGRLGGEEFVVSCPRPASAGDRRRRASARRRGDSRSSCKARASGCAHHQHRIAMTGEGSDTMRPCEARRRCLYAAKDAGRNRVITLPPTAPMATPIRSPSRTERSNALPFPAPGRARRALFDLGFLEDDVLARNGMNFFSSSLLSSSAVLFRDVEKPRIALLTSL